MCFEFEALYWAKLAEEEEKRKLAEQQAKSEIPPQEHLQDEPMPA